MLAVHMQFEGSDEEEAVLALVLFEYEHPQEAGDAAPHNENEDNEVQVIWPEDDEVEMLWADEGDEPEEDDVEEDPGCVVA